MKIFIISLLFIPILAFGSSRPKIENLPHQEECVYRAKLSAAGSYFNLSGIEKNCENIKIFWHGDESEFEISYVKKWICEGFNSKKNPISIGDQVYKNCLTEEKS